MKRINQLLLIPSLILGFFLPHYVLSQGEGDGTTIIRQGSYSLSQDGISTYETVIVFVLGRRLERQEIQQIRRIVLEGFEATPEDVLKEIRNLDWALTELSEIDDPAQLAQIRHSFRQQLASFQRQDSSNELVALILQKL